MKFSRALWLGCRRHVQSHARAGAVSLAVLLGCGLISDKLPVARLTIIVLAASALLYCCYVLAALAGMLFGISTEMRRKCSHLLVATAVIGVFVSTGSLIALTAFCAVQQAWLLYARFSPRLQLLRKLSVERRDGTSSIGDLLFPVCIAGSAWLTRDPMGAWLVGACVLAFSDTVAALVGSHLGRLRYRSFGGDKSLEGSAAFLVVTLLIVSAWSAGQTTPLALGALLAFALAITVIEAVSGMGTDNCSIPVFTVVMLHDAWPAGWMLAVSATALAALILRNRTAAAGVRRVS